MSVVTVAEVKAHLRVFINSDDALLQVLIDAAEDNLSRFMNREGLPRRDESCPDCQSDSDVSPVSGSDDLAPAVRVAVYFLVQADYEGQSADEQDKLRAAAYEKAFPYRCRLGV